LAGNVKSKRRREFSLAFKQDAIRRLEKCDSVVGLARELGICWSLLYKWRGQLERAAARSREQVLQDEVAALKMALGQKTLEVDFFKGALQKVEARRQQGGRVASTTRSGK
jgi:transposase-like protein